MTPNAEPKKPKYGLKIASARIEKELDKIPEKDYHRLRAEILSLANNPRPYGTIKLSDRVYRLRSGHYRIIYSIFEKEKLVLITKVTKRSESTYKNL